MDVTKFEDDLDRIIAIANIKNTTLLKDVIQIKKRLVNLYKRNLVKINHSVMELLTSIHLLRYGYEYVEVEKELDEILRCDVYGKKGDGDLIVEIETGFVPPEHALDPLLYYKARLASKISRYSKFASKFTLATPQQNILPIPELFMNPIKDRKVDDITKVKEICDIYYKNPPISLEDIQYGRLHTIFILNIDGGIILEFDPLKYKEILSSSLTEFMIY
ncbi:MAG: hypothetical protein QW416_04400 [Candidatus Nitrosocaldaceae archaeon]